MGCVGGGGVVEDQQEKYLYNYCPIGVTNRFRHAGYEVVCIDDRNRKIIYGKQYLALPSVYDKLLSIPRGPLATNQTSSSCI